MKRAGGRGEELEVSLSNARAVCMCVRDAHVTQLSAPGWKLAPLTLSLSKYPSKKTIANNPSSILSLTASSLAEV